MKILIFLGSVRESTPPSPKRVGERLSFYLKSLVQRVGHQVEVIDPLQISFPPVFKPHFAFAAGKAPADLESLSQKVQAADAYVMLSPEYNHSISPALSHLLNHFGSSSFGYKPSLIVTYSQGQWGGVRAAIGMRSYLGELGCLPVSSMLHVPKAHQVFDEKGVVVESEDSQRWDSYFQHGLAQLYWWATACADQKKINNPHDFIESFKKSPEQRNTPS